VSRIGGANAISFATRTAGEWVVIDLGRVQPVHGVATAPRIGSYMQRLTQFSLQTSTDKYDWVEQGTMDSLTMDSVELVNCRVRFTYRTNTASSFDGNPNGA
jgi:hypothetical protein